MPFDVVIVGAGPAGLSTACKLAQLCQDHETSLDICVIEKGSEVGAHILSGAVLQTQALEELFPDWADMGAPINVTVADDQVHLLLSGSSAIRLPSLLVPSALHNDGNHVISLGNLCRWLAEQAENLGVQLFTGFTAAEILYDDNDRVIGIATGDMGRDKSGNEKGNFEAGYEVHARYTVFAEGCRGHLGKQLIEKFKLDSGKTPQHYGIGIKELWEIPEEQHQPGKVLHGVGWPLGLGKTTGGSFLYHLDNRQVAIGLITDLNYANPWLSPFDEFQRMKHHPLFSKVLNGGKRLSYGARALAKGGIQSLPKLVFPGGILVGDNAGFLNFLKLKGTHTAIKSGLLAADSLFAAMALNQKDQGERVLAGYEEMVKASWIHEELQSSRNVAPAMHKFGTLMGSIFTFIDQVVFRGKLPFTLKDNVPDHAALKRAEDCSPIKYPAPDNTLSFDKLSSVYISNTNHEEDQPCHLQLIDEDTPIGFNLAEYDEPAQRYCPAGVYEIIRSETKTRFQINAQNCVHCKTCDIKDPTQNIVWNVPEGGGGPNYPNM
ncbi:MAG: electron transfer flavoprotein-ubiquinone oxidoreductase [Gammaproteobacteria bacterium]|nr:electron transfer flavoprotein-ubiquinone oxidoreductase [Gammaproteobacteria bacterium]